MKVIRGICQALEVQPGDVYEFRRALGLPEPDLQRLGAWLLSRLLTRQEVPTPVPKAHARSAY